MMTAMRPATSASPPSDTTVAMMIVRLREESEDELRAPTATVELPLPEVMTDIPFGIDAVGEVIAEEEDAATEVFDELSSCLWNRLELHKML